MSIVSEEWKAVVGAEGQYEVSSLGRVKSLPRRAGNKNIPGGVLAQGRHSQGYRTVCIGRQRLVHQLVCEAFIGPRNGLDVNHIDGDKTNNCLSNLEYTTRSGNVRHAMQLGLMKRYGEDNPATSVSNEQILEGYELVKGGARIVDAANAVGISVHSLRAATSGEKWKSLNLRPIRRKAAGRRLREKEKREICGLWRAGVKQSRLADAFGVSRAGVCRLVNARAAT